MRRERVGRRGFGRGGRRGGIDGPGLAFDLRERKGEQAAGQRLLLSPCEWLDHAVRPDTVCDTLGA